MAPRQRILFVDDTECLLRTYERTVRPILREAGITADTAENGESALQIVLSDLEAEWYIFSDVSMPVMDGLKFFANLKDVKGVRARKVLMSSAVVHREAVEACGAERFLDKTRASFFNTMRDLVAAYLTAAPASS